MGLAAVLLTACLGHPASVAPVQDFETSRYLGTWYEIARLDHSFERGLDQVTAEYALREDGGVSVTNRGFLASENRWQEAQGKAYFVEQPGAVLAYSRLLKLALIWSCHGVS